jgi:glycosyltransferase involved in cell wall biosynthesis
MKQVNDEMEDSSRTSPPVGTARRGAPVPRPLIVGAYAFPHGDATSSRLLQLARSATPEGVRSVVVNDLLDGSFQVPQEDETEGIQLLTLRLKGSNRLTRLCARLTRPARVLRALSRRGIGRHEISVIMLPMAMMTLGTWAVLRLALGRPVVVHADERHDSQQFSRGWLTPYFVRHRWSLFLATHLVDRAIVVSTNMAAYLRSHGLEVLVVPPQIDCGEFGASRPPSMSDGLRLLYAGTPARKDMLDVILRGISLLTPDEQKRVRLVIAGVTLEEAAATTDLDPAVLDDITADVQFLGRVPRRVVLDLLSRSHFSMLVRPTGGYASYGFPSKVPDSLAAGCPVMLNHTSDLATYVHDGVEALVLQGSTAEDVCRGIVRALLLGDERWSAMSVAAQLRASSSFDYRLWRASVKSFTSRP